MIDKYKDFKRQDLRDRKGALATEYNELTERIDEIIDERRRINKLLEELK